MATVTEVKLDVDISQQKSKLSQAREELSSLKGEFNDVPNVADALNSGQERTVSTIGLLEEKIESLDKHQKKGDASYLADIMSGMEDIDVSRQMLSSANSSFSIAFAKKIFSKFPEAVRNELNAATPEITRSIKSFANHFKSSDPAMMAGQFAQSKEFNRLRSKMQSKVSATELEAYSQLLLSQTLPLYAFKEYQKQRFGSELGASQKLTVQDILPGQFLNAFKNQGYAYKSLSSGESKQILRTPQWNQLRALISSNPGVMRAAQLVPGMIHRTSDNKTELAAGITQLQLEQLKANIWNDFENRVAGRSSERIDIYDPKVSASKLISRMSSGTAIHRLEAMRRIDELEQNENIWRKKGSDRIGFVALDRTPSLEREQYEVNKYRFQDLADPGNSSAIHSTPVMIDESQNTRLLGLSGQHNKFTDKVVMIDFSGYNEKNMTPSQIKSYEKYLGHLISGKEVDLLGDGEKYIAQSWSGTDENSVKLRMIKASSFQKILESEREWAEGVGFKGGNYWTNFLPSDFVFESTKDIRKHYDAFNKGWSPSSDTHATFDGKKFAIVNLKRGDQKFADGQTFWAKGILPQGSAQIRFAVAGKGTGHEFGYNTVGEWAVANNLITKGERYYMPGVDGQLIDMTDMSGYADVSAIKNIGAYTNSFSANEEINHAFTLALQRYGISSMKTYDEALSAANIGQQAMMFAALPPEQQAKRTENFIKRMELLDTEAGVKEFIFNNPHDPMGAALRDGRLSWLDPTVQNRVANEKASLQRRMQMGEWIDFGDMVDMPSGFNQMLNKQQITSALQSENETREAQIVAARNIVKELYEKHGADSGIKETYTDDELAAIFGLGGVNGGAVLDFIRPDQDRVTITRSPTSFNQFVTGKNYASLALPVLKALDPTFNAQGLYLSDADFEKQSSADIDGDSGKTMYGDLGEAMANVAAQQAEIIAKAGLQPNVPTKHDNLPDEAAQNMRDTDLHRLLALQRSLKAALGMGSGSAIGERISQLDQQNPQHAKLAYLAGKVYDINSTTHKTDESAVLTAEMYEAFDYGPQWQKLPKAFDTLFDVSDANEADIFRASNGMTINLKQLRDLDFDRINLPSRFHDSVAGGLIAVSKSGPLAGAQDQVSAVYEALDKSIGYGDAGTYGKQLLQNLRMQKLQTVTGLRGMATEEEQAANLSLAELTRAEQEEMIRNAKKLGGTWYEINGKQYNIKDFQSNKDKIFDQVFRQSGVKVALNQGLFGVTKEFVDEKYGDEAPTIVATLTPDSSVTLPHGEYAPAVDRLDDEISASAEDSKQNAETKKERQSSARSKKTKETKKAKTQKRKKEEDSVSSSSDSDPEKPKEPRNLLELLHQIKSGDITFNTPEDIGKRISGFINVHPGQNGKAVTAAEGSTIYQQYMRDGTVDNKYLPSDMAASQQDGRTDVSSFKDDFEAFKDIQGTWKLYSEMSDAIRSNSGKLFGMVRKHEGNPDAGFFERGVGQIESMRARQKNAQMMAEEIFGDDAATGKELSDGIQRWEENWINASRVYLSESGADTLESLRRSVSGKGDKFTKQTAQIKSWEEKVHQLENRLQAFKDSRKKINSDADIHKEADEALIKEQEEQIEAAKVLVAQGRTELLQSNNAYFKDSFDSLNEQITGKVATPQEKLTRTIQKYRERIKLQKDELEEAYRAEDSLISETDYLARKTELENLDTYMTGDEFEGKLRDRIRLSEEYRLKQTKRQESSLRKRANRQTRDPYGLGQTTIQGRAKYRRDDHLDQLDGVITAYEARIAQKNLELEGMDPNSDAYKNAASEITKMKTELKNAESAAKSLGGAGGYIGFAFSEAGERINQVISQFGRQLFHQAIQEAKRFVVEYDAAMTEIQMITGKTDSEMGQLGSGLIQTAIDMKVGVADVTSAASDLYRQGLEDEDVDVRMEDVLKFAKVANIKSAEASKIITTAQANDLVESSGEAMDALVALGDSAATTASEIAKGMQKSAASAKQAGVSYEELVTMLTIITSKTQLGGNQAGTALQTLMYRLYRVNQGEDFYDENGNRIAANKASQALGELGVNIYDENGQQRGAFDVMVDVAKNWESASNISQEMVLNALGAGRQRSNIATLIQGLAEDDGALMEKYMALASGSDGVTDEKYLAYLGSLNAALTEVKSSFDQLIASFSVSDSTTNILEFISEFIQGLASAEKEAGVLSKTIAALGASQAGIAIVSTALQGPIGWAKLATVALGAGAQGITSWLGNQQSQKTKAVDNTTATIAYIQQQEQDTLSLIERMKQINAKDERSYSEQEELKSGMTKLSNMFGDVAKEIEGPITGLADFSTALDAATLAVQKYSAQQISEMVSRIIPNIVDQAGNNMQSYGSGTNPLYGSFVAVESEWIHSIYNPDSNSGGINPNALHENSWKYFYDDRLEDYIIGDYGTDLDELTPFQLVNKFESDPKAYKRLVSAAALQQLSTNRANPLDYDLTGIARSYYEEGRFGLTFASYDELVDLLGGKNNPENYQGLLHSMQSEQITEKAGEITDQIWDWITDDYIKGVFDVAADEKILVDALNSLLLDLFTNLFGDGANAIIQKAANGVATSVASGIPLNEALIDVIQNILNESGIKDSNGELIGWNKDYANTYASDYIKQYGVKAEDGTVIAKNLTRFEAEAIVNAREEELEADAAEYNSYLEAYNEWENKKQAYDNWIKPRDLLKKKETLSANLTSLQTEGNQLDIEIEKAKQDKRNKTMMLQDAEVALEDHLATGSFLQATRVATAAQFSDNAFSGLKLDSSVSQEIIQKALKESYHDDDAWIPDYAKDGDFATMLYATMMENDLGLNFMDEVLWAMYEIDKDSAISIMKQFGYTNYKDFFNKYDYSKLKPNSEWSFDRLKAVYADPFAILMSDIEAAETNFDLATKDLESLETEKNANSDAQELIEQELAKLEEVSPAITTLYRNGSSAAISDPGEPPAEVSKPDSGYVLFMPSISQSDDPEQEKSFTEIMSGAISSGISAAELEASTVSNYNDSHLRFIRHTQTNSLNDLIKNLQLYGQEDLLEALFTGNTAQAKQLDKALVKDETQEGEYARDSEGNLVVRDDDNVIWNEYLKTLAGSTEHFANSFSASRIDLAKWAKNELDILYTGTPQEDSVFANLQTIVGDSIIGMLQNASSMMYDTEVSSQYLIEQVDAEGNRLGFVFKADEDGSYKNLPESVQRYIDNLPMDNRTNISYAEYLAWAKSRNAEIAGAIESSDEAAYINDLIQNAKYGFSGLTEQQSLTGVNSYQEQMRNNKWTDYVEGHDQSMIDAYGGGFSNWGAVSSYAQMIEELTDYSIFDLANAEEGSVVYDEIDSVLQENDASASEAKEAFAALGDEIAAVEKPYGKLTDEVIANSKAWKGNKRDVAAAFKTLNSTMSEVANNQYYREQYKAGARDSETIEAISAMTGFDKKIIKEQPELVAEMMDELVAADVETVQAKLSEFDQFLAQDDIQVQMPTIVGAGGSVDFSEAVSRLSGESAAELQTLASLLQQMGFTASIVAEQIGESVRYKILIDQMTGLGAGRKSGGGGGGGGSKSAAQKLLEEQKREQTLWEHRRKMIQYEATRYQNAGELSNYAIMLEHESKEIERQIKLREEQINSLKKQMASTKKQSDDWYEIRDAILSAEEALAELINDQKELERTQEEVVQEVIKLYVDMEQTVAGEIEARIQKERDMLDGTVSMQDVILDAIRERYQKEWELMQEDIAKKREALEEESSLIDERLQRRKDAEDKAAKYEELSEYKRQLSLISMDSSRTKDQAELREKIMELQKELAWEAAEEEAEAQKEGLQDQIDAYDDYESEYQDYLDEYLENANNFADEVNQLLSGSQEDLFRWLEENVEAYGNSLSEQQKQMLQGWKDTYDQMKGIVHTFWEEVAGTLSSKETFLEYMKQSDTYRHASASEKQQLEYTWGQMYDSWVSAKKESEEAKDYEHNDEGVSSGTSSAPKRYVVAFGGYNSSGTWVSGVISETSEYARDNQLKIRTAGLKNLNVQHGRTSKIPEPVVKPDTTPSPSKNNSSSISPNFSYSAYSDGGYVDYTGLAMVHGSKSQPEAFLSADDTALVRSMLDAWQYVANRPKITNIDAALGYGGSGTSFGDIHIEITEASFAEDADYEEVARRVGDAFTKELSKQGFRTASFNF